MNEAAIDDHCLTEHHSDADGTAGRRDPDLPEENLVLSEIDRRSVIDAEGQPGAPVDLISFGNMRETCPQCPGLHLKLVLRQTHVRAAHLFCAGCERCYDARYPDGSSAFTL